MKVFKLKSSDIAIGTKTFTAVVTERARFV